jgi:hypothetical protein
MKENETGGTRETYGGTENCRQSFGGKPHKMNHLEDIAVDRRIILK